MRNSSKTGLLLGVLALAGCSVMGSLGGGTTGTAGTAAPTATAGGTGKIVMIDLVGKTADEAAESLRAAGFTSSPEVNRIMLECEGTTKEVGRISCQAPQAGALVDRYAIINITVHEGAHHFSWSLVRAQLAKVRGMTIAEAKTYLKGLGHDGEVAVWEQPVFSNSCAAQKVCDVSPEGGTGIHDPVTLVINPNSNVDISLPP
jgi:beta-lactam-binding protein with PASTA domain